MIYRALNSVEQVLDEKNLGENKNTKEGSVGVDNSFSLQNFT